MANNTITIGTHLEPTGLDPSIVASAATAMVLFPAVYEGLVQLGPDGTPQPLLATSWEISPDGRRYLFHLRRGVHFHDGTAFDANVVKFSLDRALAPTSTNPQKTALAHVTSVEIVDQTTVALNLAAPYSNLLQVLGWGAAVMVAPNSAGTDAVLPIGTGPFRFSEWRRGEGLDLIRNPDYWGRPPAIDKATYRFIGDPNAALTALKAGDVDAFDSYPAPENIDALRKDPRYTVEIGLSQGKTIMALNNRKPPLDNPAVRRALSVAVDRQAIVKGAMFGFGEPIGSHFPPQDPDYLDLTGRYPHDPARARALLAAAGFPNGFDITLKLPPLAYARRSGEIIASQLAEVGVRVRLINLEWVSWLDQVFTRHDFDMTIVAHVEPMDYDIYGRDDYYFGYHDDAFKALLRQLDAATSGQSRHQALQAIQQKIADDAVNVFLFEYPAFGVWNKRVTGLWRMTPVRTIDLAGAHLDSSAGEARAATGGTSYRGLLAAVSCLAATLALIALLRAGPAFVGRRLLATAGVLLVASLVIFVLIQIAPGDAARFMLDMDAAPETVAALRHKLDLDGTAIQRYFRWLAGLCQGDFGTSLTYGVPVGEIIVERLRVSLPLALMALVFSTALAFLIGATAALYRKSWIDGFLSSLSQLALAIPDFWLGLLLVAVFAEHLHWVAAGGFPGWQGGPLAALRSLLLPAVALAVPQAAILARILRNQLLGALDQDYVRTARAKGLSERQALLRHALPNGLIPVLTVLGMQASFLLAGGIIVENVFALPGLGRLVFQAVTQRDLIVVQSVVLLLVLGVVGVNLVVDLTCAAIDPRWRERAER